MSFFPSTNPVNPSASFPSITSQQAPDPHPRPQNIVVIFQHTQTMSFTFPNGVRFSTTISDTIALRPNTETQPPAQEPPSHNFMRHILDDLISHQRQRFQNERK